MARKSPISYEGMELTPEPITMPPVISSAPRAAAARATIRDSAERHSLYINPAAGKALRRYALDKSTPKAKVKVHDLMLEALSEWCRRHGIQEPVRMPQGD